MLVFAANKFPGHGHLCNALMCIRKLNTNIAMHFIKFGYFMRFFLFFILENYGQSVCFETTCHWMVIKPKWGGGFRFPTVPILKLFLFRNILFHLIFDSCETVRFLSGGEAATCKIGFALEIVTIARSRYANGYSTLAIDTLLSAHRTRCTLKRSTK